MFKQSSGWSLEGTRIGREVGGYLWCKKVDFLILESLIAVDGNSFQISSDLLGQNLNS